MKYVAIALLIGNAACFAWGFFVREPPKRPPQITHRYDDAVATLELVRERDASRQQDLSDVINNPIQASAAGARSGTSNRCTAVGPFADVFSGEAAIQQIAALDIDAELRAVDEPTGETEYRVLIPPANSIEEAFRKLRELKSLGVDSYILTQGQEALGISLGLFSTIDAAESLQAQRERQGYEVVINELPQVERQFWLFDTAGEATGSRLDAWQSIAEGQPDVSVTTRTCP